MNYCLLLLPATSFGGQLLLTLETKLQNPRRKRILSDCNSLECLYELLTKSEQCFSHPKELEKFPPGLTAKVVGLKL